MKLNGLGFLSLLALIGILGITTENRGLLGFLGFSYYFRYFFVTPDELLVQNMRKAASIGFFTGVAATGLAVVLHAFMPSVVLPNMVLAAAYFVSVFCFTIAIVVLEYKEQRGCS